MSVSNHDGDPSDTGPSEKKLPAYILARRRLRVSLTVFLLVIYAVYISFLSVAQDFAKASLFGGSINVGVGFAIAIAVISFATTLYYAMWTNRHESEVQASQP